MAADGVNEGHAQCRHRQQRTSTALACVIGLVASACTSAMFGADKSTFSQAEVDRALAPASQIERACYAGSSSKRRKLRVRSEFIAYVNARGQVHAEPVSIDADDPQLLACLQRDLEQLSFPAKGATDQLHLRFELTP